MISDLFWSLQYYSKASPCAWGTFKFKRTWGQQLTSTDYVCGLQWNKPTKWNYTGLLQYLYWRGFISEHIFAISSYQYVKLEDLEESSLKEHSLEDCLLIETQLLWESYMLFYKHLRQLRRIIRHLKCNCLWKNFCSTKIDVLYFFTSQKVQSFTSEHYWKWVLFKKFSSKCKNNTRIFEVDR